MANQIIIDIGAVANDGTGDPLRTAFNYVNNNFSNIWATGVANSNIQFSGNKILTTNVNGNLILAPNGIGKVQSNVDIVPNANNTLSLGSLTRQWNTVYAQNLTVAGDTAFNNLIVSGNLTVQGNTIQIGNIVTDTKTIQLANTAATANAANGSGITVGANDNIATMLYSSTSNTWVMNIGANVTGNVTAPYFFGNGSQLTGLPVQYGNANVVTLLAGFGSNTITTTGNITGGFILGNISQANGLPATYSNANAVAYGESGWAGNIVPSGNAVYSLGNATNQWNDLYVSNTTIFMNNVPITLGAGNVLAVNGNAVLQNNSNTTISTTGNVTSGNLISPTLNNTGNISVVASGNTWTFVSDGATIFPTLTVTRGDRSGSLTGQALLFGDSTQEALISTPNGTNAIASSQRFVINPGAGAANTTGEGGDIYLYAGRGGDAGGTGGDIKIRGGLGPVDGDGGYLDIMGGEAAGNGVGGRIDIQGGESGNSNGGVINIYGGQGRNGGDANIQGGTGTAGPGGDVSIIGGASSNGQAEYGNVIVATGSKNWQFTNTGNLVLPQGGVVYETNIPFGSLDGNTIALKPSGGIDADQQLLIYPTVIPGTDDNHLHLTTGNLYNTELFLGNDNLYVKLANTGNVVINSNNDVGNSAQWIFGTSGNLTLPGNTFAVNYANGTAVALGGNYGNANVAANLAAFGSNPINTTGNITGSNLIATGNIVLTGSLVGSGASPAPTLSGFSSISTTGATGNITASGNVSGGNLISSATIYGNVDVVLGNIANASATRTRFVSDTTFSYIQTGNGTANSTGNIVFSPYQSSTQRVVINTASGNLSAVGNIVTSGNFVGNGAALSNVTVSVAGNIIGTQSNVTLVAGSYSTVIDNTGNLTLPGNTFAVNYANNTPVDVVTRFEGTWTVPVGNSTQSFTVTPNNTYNMWVEGNIPNGIIVWNATATVTNTNVPVAGAQYAWVYNGGGAPIDFTSIPNQFEGISNTIVRSNVAPSTTTNRFDFGINNTSGNSQTVRYGWIQIS
jgi:hypothetical protein